LSSSANLHVSSKPVFRVDVELKNWMIDIRRRLHQFPELSFREFKTSRYIRAKLSELDLSAIETLGETGLSVTLGPGPDELPGVGLRADMDALPVEEKTGLPFASKNPGAMHACGHDGHVAMLLGAAALLNRENGLPGRVKLIFQPAEEHGNGAELLVQKGVLDNLSGIFSGHVDTHFQTGEITVDEGIICAFADPFRICITGRGGHAARPHEATDAIVAASSLVMIIQTLVSREVDPNKAEVITIGSFQGGTVHNVIADKAHLKGTVRSTDTSTREKTIAGLRRVVQSIETMYDVNAEIVFEHGMPAVTNSHWATEVARTAAWDTTAVERVISQGFPSLGGEDFAFYQKHVEGCMVRFGGAPENTAGPAHSSTFDFDENCLEIGACWLANVAWRWLEQAKSPMVP
jgi:hippurate hydrolase